MKKGIPFLIAATVTIFSCKQEAYHLPKEKMEAVITDIQLAETMATMAGFDTTQKTPIQSNDSLAVYYSEVLAHHQITLQQFRESLNWYRQHPNLLDSVYVKSMATLANPLKAK